MAKGILIDHVFKVFGDAPEKALELVKQGLGIGIQDGVIGDREPLVRRVLPDLEPINFSMWLVTHREVSTSRRIRVVFDLLAEELSKQ